MATVKSLKNMEILQEIAKSLYPDEETPLENIFGVFSMRLPYMIDLVFI